MSLCDRCIHRDVCGNEDAREEAVKVCDDFISILAVLERKKGEWVKDGNRGHWYACSRCGQVIYSESAEDRKEFWAFCSKCGADMSY